MARNVIERRRFLQAGAAGLLGGGAYLLGCRADRPRSAKTNTTHAMATAADASPTFHPDVEMELDAIADEVGLLPGARTAVWRFAGKVLRGDSEALTFLEGTVGGPRFVPVIRARRGQKLRIVFNNRLPEASIVHWHGLHIVQRMDGHPRYAIASGERYVYEFVVGNRAGTYWFHPHPHGRTGYQVYHGLAGLFLVSDEEEDAAQLPDGEFDLPLVIQDRSFDQGNQLIYLGRGMGMMERMMGFMGERVLVNASPDYVRRVERRPYRLRLFNGSNASGYRLSLSDGQPFMVIGTDGGLLEQAMTRQSLTLAVAERVDVWIDFGALQPGQELSLIAQPFAPMMGGGRMGMGRGMGMGMMGRTTNAGPRSIARFRAGNGAGTKSPPPERLSAFPALSLSDAVNGERPREIHLSMMHGQVFLNDRTFDMEAVAEDEKVRLGSTEVWEFVNDSPMAHPMHLHNVHFKVIERTGVEGSATDRTGLSAGFTDEGLKDVVLVLPGERVRVLMKFEDYTGLYLYHCHILEHEDLGMMRNYLVEPA